MLCFSHTHQTAPPTSNDRSCDSIDYITRFRRENTCQQLKKTGAPYASITHWIHCESHKVKGDIVRNTGCAVWQLRVQKQRECTSKTRQLVKRLTGSDVCAENESTDKSWKATPWAGNGQWNCKQQHRRPVSKHRVCSMLEKEQKLGTSKDPILLFEMAASCIRSAYVLAANAWQSRFYDAVSSSMMQCQRCHIAASSPTRPSREKKLQFYSQFPPESTYTKAQCLTMSYQRLAFSAADRRVFRKCRDDSVMVNGQQKSNTAHEFLASPSVPSEHSLLLFRQGQHTY